MTMNGKSVLITGSGTGIGRATALRLAKEGANIAVHYSRSEQEARETMEELAALGVQTLLVQADVSDDAQVRRMVGQTVEAFGGLDVLVNNAGTTRFVPHDDLEGLTDADWDAVWDVNVKGSFYCCRAAAGELKKRRGSIINISSVAGLTGLGSSIAYAASKAALISMTKSLARALGPDIRVNSVAPGIVDTRWIAGQAQHMSKLGDGTPLGRIAQPEDVAEVVYALAASAGFVTGQTWQVDGGKFI